MWLWTAFVSAIIFGVGGFMLKVGSHQDYPGPTMLLGLYLAGSVIFLGGVITTGTMTMSWLVILFSLLIGLGSYYGNTFLVKAYATGPACLTSPLMSLNILLVIIMSTLIYDEKINAWQYLGVACMMLAVSLLSSNRNNTLIKSRRWAICVTLAILFIFMREGGLKIAHENGLNNLNILFFGYLFACVLALGKLWLSRHRATASISTSTHGHAFLFGAMIGLFSATGMGLLAYAMALGPASVVVPIFSARNFVAVILFVIFFKEKLSWLQWFAVGLLILGILFISHL
jgi:drug/metabolite transporter (DMT)-like permease